MASVLPTTSPFFFNEQSRSQRQQHYGNQRRIPHMDMKFAIWQVAYLIIAPRRVYKTVYYHKQTKNKWARDDPAFPLLIVALLCLASIAWGVAYDLSARGIFTTMLRMILFDFLSVGMCIATLNWAISNRFLTHNISTHATEQKVEWAYAFDVHCNSFIPVYFLLYVLQFFFLPLLQSRSWIASLIGNSIYCIASLWYIHVTYLGYQALPFLVHAELFRYPMFISLVLFIVSLLGFNVSRSVLAFYFH